MGQDDIIDRLMSVERDAESLVNDAQTESERILREAEQEERQKHDDALAARQHELSAELELRRKQLDAVRTEEINNYRSALNDRELDPDALRSSIDEILKNHRA
jgi:vacuolar-type H+-ATPase subunit H